MKKSVRTFALLLPCAVFLAGCAGNNYEDLDEFMAEVKARPKAPIDPIPLFAPYRPFSYGATAKRAPFEKPIPVTNDIVVNKGPAVEPDWDRSKEYLEDFNLESLAMVGTLSRDGALWALIDDGVGRVHMVQTGNYMGRNHGKVVEVTESYLSVVEIISDGEDSWTERPRTMALKESE